MKQAFALLLSAVFLFNVCGYHFLYSFSLSAIRKEAKQGYKNANKETLELDPHDRSLVWVTPDEIEYKGTLYDVLCKKEQDGKLILTCFNDTKETELNRFLDQHVKDHVSGNADGKQKGKEQSKKANVLFSANIPSFFNVIFISSVMLFHTAPRMPSSAFLPVAAPPPDRT